MNFLKSSFIILTIFVAAVSNETLALASELTPTAIEKEFNNGNGIKVDFNEDALQSKVNQSIGTTIDIELMNLSNQYSLHFSNQLYNELVTSQKDLKVITKEGSYLLPTGSLEFRNLGTAKESILNLPDTVYSIFINKFPEESTAPFLAEIKEDGYVQVGDLINYEVRPINYDHVGSILAMRDKNNRKWIQLPSTIDTKDLTGVSFNPDTKEYVTVPTTFYSDKQGRHWAVLRINHINSRSENMLTYGVIRGKKTFSDIQNSFAKDEIEMLASKRIINGNSNGTYSPNQHITRAQFAAILTRSLRLYTPRIQKVFDDVSGGVWYWNDVYAATTIGIIKGYEDNTFRPNQKITRHQMAVMLSRALNFTTEEKVTADLSILNKLMDKKSITWGQQDVAIALEKGIVSGHLDGTFRPNNYATRAQSAVMLQRFLIEIDYIQ